MLKNLRIDAFLYGRISFLFAVALIVLMPLGAVIAQDDRELGKGEFMRSCAACHGTDGKGHGPVAKTLKQQPSDLTSLAENNRGIFPIARVFAVIDGRIQIIVHGPREMPVWGDVYTQELSDRTPRDFMSRELRDTLVRVRLLTLVEYLSTIQSK